MATIDVLIATAVTREANWFTNDPPVGGSFNAAPPLQSANGGPFTIVQAYLPAVDMEARALYIYRPAGGSVVRVGAGGVMTVQHDFVALIEWPYLGGNAAGSMEAELQALDAALGAVVARIVGPLGDKSHGGQFASVGEGDSGTNFRFEFEQDPYDVALRGGPFRVRIRYTADDFFIA